MFETCTSSDNHLREKQPCNDSARAILQSIMAAKAAALARFGYLEKAERILLPLVESRQATADLLVLMARIYAQQNRRDDAKRMLHQVLKLDPLHGEAQKILCKLDSVFGGSNSRSFTGRIALGIALLALASTACFYWTPVWDLIDRFYQTIAEHNSIAYSELKDESPAATSDEPQWVVSVLGDDQPQAPLSAKISVQSASSISSPTNVTSSSLDPNRLSESSDVIIPPSESPRVSSPADRTENPLPENSPSYETNILSNHRTENSQLNEQEITALRSNDLFKKYSLTVNQKEGVIQIAGEVPSLPIRFVIENIARSITGTRWIDIGNLRIAKTYTVNPGDSLWTIARQKYGDPKYWIDIAKANELTVDHPIRVGQKLFLPALDSLGKSINQG